MTIRKFLLLLVNPVVKAFMFENTLISIDTVGALATSWMLAFDSSTLHILWSDSQKNTHFWFGPFLHFTFWYSSSVISFFVVGCVIPGGFGEVSIISSF
jgi:hypothetical protein